MNLLTDRLPPVFRRYLVAAFGSTTVAAVYGIVDMIAVGQSQGPNGVAALAVVLPFWTIIYAFGLMMGIGGGVLFGKLKGKMCARIEKANEYFTSAVIFGLGVGLLVQVCVFAWEREIFTAFGARGPVLELALDYVRPLKWLLPFFLFTQLLGGFLRNDNAPNLAMAAVLAGGALNVFGDWFFVFPLGWGMFGAGLATGLGAALTVCIQCLHFFRPHTLALRRPSVPFFKMKTIFVVGFSAFFFDLSIGIVTVLFNRQILALVGDAALAVFGVQQTIVMMAQCCAYAVGQSAQPILSINLGAGLLGRVRETRRLALTAVAAVSAVWFLLPEAFPNAFVRLFMKPTDEILSIAPGILRMYSVSMLLLPFNVFAGYYFQSVLRPGDAMVVSVMRGLVLSGALVFLLPAFLPAWTLWLAMPLAEFATACYAGCRMFAARAGRA